MALALANAVGKKPPAAAVVDMGTGRMAAVAAVAAAAAAVSLQTPRPDHCCVVQDNTGCLRRASGN